VTVVVELIIVSVIVNAVAEDNKTVVAVEMNV
jgi:hypothetical protein